MKNKIEPELKPLSANVKRLNIGLYLIEKKDFLFDLEEYELDDLWQSSYNMVLEKYRLDYISDIYNETIVLTLNRIYLEYLEKRSFLNVQNNSKIEFHNFFTIIFENYLKNIDEVKDYSKLIDSLKELRIVENSTLTAIDTYIDFKRKNTHHNLKITTEVVNPNNNIKYQIFISSTFIDLKEERQAAVEAILKKGHIPAGMELFTAGDKSQWDVIKKWIDESDIYLLILGGRYGSIDNETGLSYTEMEYNYAIEKGKPFFALSLTDEILDKKQIEIIKDFDLKSPKYIAFKEKVKTKMCSFPNNIDQIKNEINHSLDTLISENKEKMQGWIKGTI